MRNIWPPTRWRVLDLLLPLYWFRDTRLKILDVSFCIFGLPDMCELAILCCVGGRFHWLQQGTLCRRNGEQGFCVPNFETGYVPWYSLYASSVPCPFQRKKTVRSQLVIVSRIQLNKRITVPPMSTIQRTVKLENDFDTDVCFQPFPDLKGITMPYVVTMSLHFASVFPILKRAMSPDTVFMQVVFPAPFSGKKPCAANW
jgi:hypothetical protein